MPQPCVLVLTGAFPGGLGFSWWLLRFTTGKAMGAAVDWGFSWSSLASPSGGGDSPRLVPLAAGRAGVGNTTEVALHVYKPRLRVD